MIHVPVSLRLELTYHGQRRNSVAMGFLPTTTSLVVLPIEGKGVIGHVALVCSLLSSSNHDFFLPV